jgi:hypothetical protein
LAAVDVDGPAVQPAPSGRDREGDDVADVLGRSEAGDVELAAVMLDRRRFVDRFKRFPLD